MSKDTFDYTGYASQVGVQVPDGLTNEDLSPETKDLIYSNAITKAYKENLDSLKDQPLSTLERKTQAIQGVLDVAPDARPILGLKEESADPDAPYKIDNLLGEIQSKGNVKDMLAQPIANHVGSLSKRVTEPIKIQFENPLLEGTTAKQFAAGFYEKNGLDKTSTVGDLLSAQIENNPDLKPLKRLAEFAGVPAVDLYVDPQKLADTQALVKEDLKAWEDFNAGKNKREEIAADGRGSLRRGIAQGIENFNASGYGFAEYGFRLFGDEEDARKAHALSNQHKAEAAKIPTLQPTDYKGIGDIPEIVGGTIGSILPMAAASIPAAVAGAVLAPSIGIGAAAGAGIGMGLAGAARDTGTFYSDAVDKVGADKASMLTAGVLGSASGALDAYGIGGKAVKTLATIGTPIAKKAASSLFKVLVKEPGSEAVQEVAQQALQDLNTVIQDPSTPASDALELKNYINSALGGYIGGVAFTGVHHAGEAISSKFQSPEAKGLSTNETAPVESPTTQPAGPTLDTTLSTTDTVAPPSTSNTVTQPAVDVRDSSPVTMVQIGDTTVAAHGQNLAEGATPTEAYSNLVGKVNEGNTPLSADAIKISPDDSVASVELPSGGKIEVSGPGKEQNLQTLIDLHNADTNPVVLNEPIKIKQFTPEEQLASGGNTYGLETSDGAIALSGKTLSDVYARYQQVKSSLDGVSIIPVPEPKYTAVELPAIPEGTALSSGKDVAAKLEADGAFIMKSRGDNLLTGNHIKFFKDGYVYETKTSQPDKTLGSKQTLANVKAYEPQTKGVPKEVASSTQIIRDSNDNIANLNVTLHRPVEGIKVLSERISGNTVHNIDLSSVVRIANKVGGKVAQVNGEVSPEKLLNSTEGVQSAQIALPSGQKILFSIDAAGKTNVLTNGRSFDVTHGFQISDLQNSELSPIDKVRSYQSTLISGLHGSEHETIYRDAANIVTKSYNSEADEVLTHANLKSAYSVLASSEEGQKLLRAIEVHDTSAKSPLSPGGRVKPVGKLEVKQRAKAVADVKSALMKGYVDETANLFQGLEEAKALHILYDASELPVNIADHPLTRFGSTLGVTHEGRMYMFAGNLMKNLQYRRSHGEIDLTLPIMVRATFFHELVHRNADTILGLPVYDSLSNEVHLWKDTDHNSATYKIYDAATRQATIAAERAAAEMTKAGKSQTEIDSARAETFRREFLAYAVSEAYYSGISKGQPTGRVAVAKWFDRVFKAFERIITKLTGLKKGFLKPDDLVVIANGLLQSTSSFHKKGLKIPGTENLIATTSTIDTSNYADLGKAQTGAEIRSALTSGIAADTLGLAPNGKDTNLSVGDYTMTRTDAFKAWFGDFENLKSLDRSLAVDENGDPRVYYAVPGTEGSSTVFSPNAPVTPNVAEVQEVSGLYKVVHLGEVVDVKLFRSDAEAAVDALNAAAAPTGVMINTRNPYRLSPGESVIYEDVALQGYDSVMGPDGSIVPLRNDATRVVTDGLTSYRNPEAMIAKPLGNAEFTALLDRLDSLLSSEPIESAVQENISQFFDGILDGEPQITFADGKATITDIDGTTIISTVDSENKIQTLKDEILTASTFFMEPNADKPGQKSSSPLEAKAVPEVLVTAEDMKPYLAALPTFLQDMIEIHYDFDSRAERIFKSKDLTSVFRPWGVAGGKRIHIAAYAGTSKAELLSRLGRGTSMFNWTSWGSAEGLKIYEKAYDMLEQVIKTEVSEQYENFGINPEKITLKEKRTMVVELLAKLGMSFIDIDANHKTLAKFEGLDLAALKKDISSAVETVVFDLSTKAGPLLGKTDAQDFVRSLIVANTAPSVAGVLNVEYTVDHRPGGQGATATMTIQTRGHYGSRKTIVPNDKLSRSLHERMAFIQEGKTLNSQKGRGVMVRNWMYSPNFMRSFGTNLLGNSNAILLAQLGRTMAEDVSNKQNFTDLLRIKAVFNDYHIPIESVTKDVGHEETLRNAGVTNAKHLEFAKEIDTLMTAIHNQSQSVHAAIMAEFYDQMDLLASQAKGTPSEVYVSGWIAEMRNMMERFQSDWDHRRYEAHTPEGANKLIKMQTILTDNDSYLKFTTDAEVSKLAMESLDNQLRAGTITQAEYQKSSSLHKENIQIEAHLEALRLWAEHQLGQVKVADRSQDSAVNRLNKMKDAINDTLKTNADKNGNNLVAKFELIPSVMNRKLDPSIPADALYMRFLGEIKNPLEVAVYNLEQRNNVYSKLVFNKDLFMGLLRAGIATLQGTTNPVNTEGSILSWKNRGTLLKYLHIDAEWEAEIAHEVERVNGIFQHDVMSNIVGLIKTNLTVLNPKVFTSNYVSNLGMLIVTGAIFNQRGHGTEGANISATEGRNRLGGRAVVTTEYAAERQAEMRKHNLFGTSNTAIESVLNESLYPAKIVGAVVNVMNQFGLIGNERATNITLKTNEGFNKVRELYGYGDEFLKPFIYIGNFELGMDKARSEIKRSDFAADKIGEARYQKALKEIAVEFGVERTRRETTSWDIQPDWLKKLSGSKTRLFLPDFFGQLAQVARMHITTLQNIEENVSEMRNLSTKENTPEVEAYRAALKRDTWIRSFGQMFFGCSATAMMFGAYAVIPSIVSAIADGLSGDRDDARKRRKSKDGSVTGLIDLVDFVRTMQPAGSMFQSPIYQVGNKVYTLNIFRQDIYRALVPTPKGTTDIGAIGWDMLGQVASNFINLKADGITTQLINAISSNPTDRFGKPMSHEKAFQQVFQNYFMPGVAKYAASFVLGETPQGKERNRALTALEVVTGYSVKEIDMEKQLVYLGQKAARATSVTDNPVKHETIARLKLGERLSDRDIVGLATKLRDADKEVYDEMTFAIRAYRRNGFSDSDIRIGLSHDPDTAKGSGLSQDAAGKLVHGKNAFNDNTLTSLRNVKVALQSQRVGSEHEFKTTEQKRNAIDNVTRVIDSLQKMTKKQ